MASGKQNEEVKSASEATRLSLILAAENLFGDRGVDAASLRAICTKAHQRNVSSVQYHFGDKYGLLRAVLEYRESQIEPMRKFLLNDAKAKNRLGEVRTLLRILFEPYARMFLDEGNICYIKLISSYTNQVRKRRGVPHPADYHDESYPSLQEAMDLLRKRLSFLDKRRFDRRADTVGAMFFGAFIRFATSDPEQEFDKYLLYEDTLEMMAAAMAAPPYLP